MIIADETAVLSHFLCHILCVCVCVRFRVFFLYLPAKVIVHPRICYTKEKKNRNKAVNSVLKSTEENTELL